MADALSRVHREDPVPIENPAGTVEDVLEEADDALFCSFGDAEIYDCFDCYLNLPDMNVPANNPLNLQWIREQQQADQELLDKLAKYPDRYMYKEFDDVEDLICYVRPGDDPENKDIT